MPQTLELQISDNAQAAARNVDRLVDALRNLGSALPGVGLGQLARQLTSLSQSGGVNQFTVGIENIQRGLSGFVTAIQNAQPALANFQQQMSGIGRGMRNMSAGTRDTSRSTGNLGQTTRTAGNSVAELETRVRNLQTELNAVKRQLREYREATGQAGKATDQTSIALTTLRDNLRGAFAPLGRLINQFGRVMRMRIFRTILRQITQGFSEGLKNVRAYSEAIGGLYAKDMAGLDNATLKLKNSLGAALAPAIQALLPILHTLINYVIEAANVFNQFMALMNGSGQWTRAIDVVASDFEDAEKGASGAAKAAKELLADWDELNIIASESGSGGGSGGTNVATDYEQMFEEAYRFEGWIVDLTSYLREHLPIVSGLLAGITEFLLGIRNIGVITVSIGLVTLIDNAADIAKNGFTMENIQTAVVGTLATALGSAWLGGEVGAKMASVGGVRGAILGAAAGIAIGAIITLYPAFQFSLQNGDIENAVLRGLGIAAESALAGAALGALFGHPVIGAISGLAVGVIIDLIAYYTLDRDNRATDESLLVTQEQLEELVATRMFKTDIRTVIHVLNSTVDNLEDIQGQIADALAGMQVPLNNLRLGVNKEESYEELKKQIFGEDGHGGIIGMIDEYARRSRTMISTYFSIAPIYDDSGIDISGMYIDAAVQGWDIVTNYVHGLGAQLGAELSKGFNEDGLANFDEELVQTLTQKLANVSRIMAFYEASTQALTNFGVNLRSGEMTAVQAFRVYQSELSEGLYRANAATAAQYGSFAVLMETLARDNPDQAEFYEGQATKLRGMEADIRSQNIDDLTREYGAAGAALLMAEVANKDFRVGKPGEVELAQMRLGNWVISETLGGSEGTEGLRELYSRYDEAGNNKGRRSVLLNQYLNRYGNEVFGADTDIINTLVDSGYYTMRDFFSEEAWEDALSGNSAAYRAQRYGHLALPENAGLLELAKDIDAGSSVINGLLRRENEASESVIQAQDAYLLADSSPAIDIMEANIGPFGPGVLGAASVNSFSMERVNAMIAMLGANGRSPYAQEGELWLSGKEETNAYEGSKVEEAITTTGERQERQLEQVNNYLAMLVSRPSDSTFRTWPGFGSTALENIRLHNKAAGTGQ